MRPVPTAALLSTLLALSGVPLTACAEEPRSYPQLLPIMQADDAAFERPIQTAPPFTRPLGPPARKATGSAPSLIQTTGGVMTEAAPGLQGRFSEPIMAPPATFPESTAVRAAPAVYMPEIPSSPPVPYMPPPASRWQSVSGEVETFGAPTIPPNDGPVVAPPTIDSPTAMPERAPISDSLQTEEFVGDSMNYPSDPWIAGNCPGNGNQCDNLCPEPNINGRFSPFFGGGIKPGNHRVISGGGFFIPLWQDAESLLYTNLVGRGDDQGAADGFFGIGYRQFMDPNWIFGTYLFYDLRASDQHNFYSQANLGLELFSLNWDFRFNGYFPGSDDKSAYVQSGYSDGTLITRNFRERAYPGFDFEVGERFLYWGWNDRYEVRWFLGGYYFEHSADGYPSFGGPRGRLEMRIHDLGWMGPQSRLEFGVESSYDRIRNEQIFGYVRLRIPFGGGGKTRDLLGPMRRRMVDLPVRPVD
ncbi:inverse autotransporter beta domain-containing protein [Planctomicrobium piriforme]|uniref:Invasin beta-domain of outer membrane n=1 Tax=Planctomicrobium piriforme TaxID=1576369 RepID=A0A1I3SJH8_9PLAN|nr:inverse autotransporter beta domain-containing protein [Planctomicrobium piriforme]SFJ57879.1 Invasin beta-domain of outer membrane [Planctomicrobium piriforme]